MAWNPSFGTSQAGQFDFNGFSDNPSLATNLYNTKDDASNAFFAAHPEFAQYQSQLQNAVTFGSGGSPQQQQAQQANTTGGGDLSSLMQQLFQPGYNGDPTQVAPTFFGGTDLQNAVQYGGTNVGPASLAQGASAGPAAQYGGTQTGPAAQTSGANLGFSNVDPGLLASLGPQSTIDQINQGYAPVMQQQQRQLQQALAEAGVVGGAAVNAETNLGRNQTAAIAPTIASAIQNSQGNMLSAANTGAGLQQQTGQFNTGAQNSLQQLLAGLQQQTGLANTSAQNDMSRYNAGLQQQTGQFNAGQQQELTKLLASLQQQTGMFNAGNQNDMLKQYSAQQQQTGIANTGAANNATQINAGAQNAVDTANVDRFNGSNQNMLQQIMQQYYAQMQGKQSAILGGQSAGNQIGVGQAGNFQIPTGNGASGLAGILGSIYSQKPNNTPPVQNTSTTPITGVGYQQPPYQPPPQGVT